MRSLIDAPCRSLTVIAALLALGCSSEITQSGGDGPLNISGSYDGIASGIDAGRTFEEVFVDFTFFHTDTVLTGGFEINTGSGTLIGHTIEGAGAFTIEFELTQTAPCPGELTGSGEVRRGTTLSGSITLGIVGTYEGTYCQGDVTAEYFVELRR
jgi:hypothetical protein